MLMRAFQNQSTALARWLSLLLVVFILYGTTVEAAHRHGRILPSHHASQVESNQPNSPVSSKTGCSDCLICQLHQNFATILISFGQVDPPAQTQIRVTTTVPTDVHFQLTAPTAGRAPPFIS